MNKIKFFPFYILSSIPFLGMYILSDIASLILFYFVRYRRKVVRSNLIMAFPEKSRKEIFSIERKFYRHFCDIFFESVKVLTISKKSISKRFVLKNPELLQKFYAENKSVIMYSGHHGNWEWFTFLPLSISHQLIAFYQPQSSKYFGQLMKLIRDKYGAECVESAKGYKTILQYDRENILTMNIIIGDQSPSGNSSKYWTKFFGQDTAFLVGADRIAKKSNQAVIFPSFKKTKRGCYEVTFELLQEGTKSDKNQHVIEKYAQALEKSIKKSPELWLWSHRRWKLKKSDL
jgi:KDO2-lipid IV(A) lauroyltransferase